jgi:hypothetical protein
MKKRKRKKMLAAEATLQRLWNGSLSIEANSARVARRCAPPVASVITTATPILEPPPKPKPVKVRKPSPQPPRPNLVSFSSNALVALPRRNIQKHVIQREETLRTLAERRNERASYSSAIDKACSAYKSLV